METYLWHEDTSHKNLYETEIDILKRGLNGDFKLFSDPLIENGRIVALGELSFGENQKQAIKIIFPTKYPYSPPKLIAVTANFSSDGELIQPPQPYHFGKGNQYDDGSLCLFRKSYWNPNNHNIGWTLRRAQKWLKSVNSTEGFKPDEIVKELPSLMKHQGQVLIPKEIFLPHELNSGFFTLTQFKPNHYILEQNLLPSSTFALKINLEVFKWYSFGKGVCLKNIFENLNALNIINTIQNNFGENILEGEPIKNVAFYLPDEENPWHFFKFKIEPNAINIQYYISRIISKELYLRTKDIFDDQILLGKKVSIIGLGALGGEVAKSLAKNGVGHFNLFDFDTFEIGNSIRHAADLYYIGEDKVNVVKQLILRSNPNISVNSYKIDVLNDAGLLEKSLNESDICICLTAEESVDYLINDKYIQKYNIPFIFARASEGAFSGAVQVVNQKSACLRCLSLSDKDKLPEPKGKIKLTELKPEYGSCSEPALPGSEIDAKEIALMVARISIQCLLQDVSSNYPKLTHSQFYWHGPYGSDEKEPFTWEMKNTGKHPDCKICQ